MNAKLQVEQHILNQSSVMLDWQTSRPQIKKRIISLEKRIERIEALEALLHKALLRIEKLEQRPSGIKSLFK
jgi:hypothetical protein